MKALGRFVLLLGASLLVAAPPTAFAGDPDGDADPYDNILRDYRRRVKKGGVEGAVRALQLLDPANPRSLPELVEILRAGHWFVRGHAIDALAEVPDGPLRAEMRLHLITHDHTWVREGLAYAISARPVAGDAEALVAALDDEEWRVRRTSARALGEIVSREGVERLVQALGEESDLRVLVWVRASLRAVSGADMGRDVRRWQEWWKRHKDRPEWTRQGEEVTREEFDGVPLETVTIDSPPRPGSSRDKRPELFVLAPFGYSHGYFRPYLDEASEFVRITYVTLPTVREVTKQSGFGASIPVYPVERLARALDDLREKHEKEQIVILADGPVAWIAEKYALRYPKRTAGLVLVNGWLDRVSYGGALMRLAAQGTSAERWAANTLTSQIETTRDIEEGRRLRRIFLTHALTDRRDSEAWRLWKSAARDHGFCSVPALAFSRKVKIHVPTLFYFPGESIMSGGTSEDLRRIRASFKEPPPITAVLRESRGLAHIEDPQEFLRVLRGYLQYARLLD
jgi:pimeloyl-ACP methyl ester carboxylesterase